MSKRRKAPNDAPSTFKAPGYAKEQRAQRDREEAEWAARNGPVVVKKENLKMKKALIVVDVQNDFCEGGALAVSGGNTVALRIASLMKDYGYHDEYDETVFTKDFHKPHDSNGGHIALPPEKPDFIDTWPAHCIQGTQGSDLHPELAFFNTGSILPVFLKGDGVPAYSGFEGTDRFSGMLLSEHLMSKGVTHVDVVGIAADYCVRATAFDAIDARLFKEVTVLPEYTVGIHKDGEQIAAEVKKAQDR